MYQNSLLLNDGKTNQANENLFNFNISNNYINFDNQIVFDKNS